MVDFTVPEPLKSDFCKLFIEQGACWRCIFVMFKLDSLSLYRQHDYTDVETSLGLKASPQCSICNGVLQQAETYTSTISDAIQ